MEVFSFCFLVVSRPLYFLLALPVFSSYPPPLTQSFFRTTPCDGLHVFFFFCTGITAFNHMAHVRSAHVWSHCVYNYAHPVFFFFARVALFFLYICEDGVEISRVCSGRETLLACVCFAAVVCVVVVCLVFLFSLDYITVCLGDDRRTWERELPPSRGWRALAKLFGLCGHDYTLTQALQLGHWDLSFLRLCHSDLGQQFGTCFYINGRISRYFRQIG